MRALFEKEKARAVADARRAASAELEAAVKAAKGKQWSVHIHVHLGIIIKSKLAPENVSDLEICLICIREYLPLYVLLLMIKL